MMESLIVSVDKDILNVAVGVTGMVEKAANVSDPLGVQNERLAIICILAFIITISVFIRLKIVAFNRIAFRHLLADSRQIFADGQEVLELFTDCCRCDNCFILLMFLELRFIAINRVAVILSFEKRRVQG